MQDIGVIPNQTNQNKVSNNQLHTYTINILDNASDKNQFYILALILCTLNKRFWIIAPQIFCIRKL